MKLFRAEISPLVDLVADVSGSMTFTAAKAARLDALMVFCAESAARAGAPVRVYAVNGRDVQAVPVESVRGGNWRGGLKAEKTKPAAGSLPGPLPWRTGALKVLISDLLYPGDPTGVLAAMAVEGGHAIVLAPGLAEEADVPARGNVELVDCEGAPPRRQRIDEALAERYRAAYARHFGLWREAARRRGVGFARVACEGSLVEALTADALAAGAVELNA